MPKKRTPKVKRIKKEARITREHIKEATSWLLVNSAQVPCLWGPTASGKTFMARQLAGEMGAKMVTVLLHMFTPDESTGFQVPISDKLVHQVPEWFRRVEEHLAEDKENKAMVFLDELGLAREETLGTIFTLLRERQLRERDLPRDRVYLMAATNPAVLPPTLRTRLALIHVPHDPEYLAGIASGSQWAEYVVAGSKKATESKEPAYSNEPPPPPEIIDAASTAAIKNLPSGFWALSLEAQVLIWRSLLPAADAESIIRHIYKPSRGNVDKLIEDPDVLCQVLSSLDRPRSTELALSALVASMRLPQEKMQEVWAAVIEGVSTNKEKFDDWQHAPRPKDFNQVVGRLQSKNESRMRELLERRKLIIITKTEVSGPLVEVQS